MKLFFATGAREFYEKVRSHGAHVKRSLNTTLKNIKDLHRNREVRNQDKTELLKLENPIMDFVKSVDYLQTLTNSIGFYLSTMENFCLDISAKIRKQGFAKETEGTKKLSAKSLKEIYVKQMRELSMQFNGVELTYLKAKTNLEKLMEEFRVSIFPEINEGLKKAIDNAEELYLNGFMALREKFLKRFKFPIPKHSIKEIMDETSREKLLGDKLDRYSSSEKSLEFWAEVEKKVSSVQTINDSGNDTFYGEFENFCQQFTKRFREEPGVESKFDGETLAELFNVVKLNFYYNRLNDQANEAKFRAKEFAQLHGVFDDADIPYDNPEKEKIQEHRVVAYNLNELTQHAAQKIISNKSGYRNLNHHELSSKNWDFEHFLNNPPPDEN